MHYYIPLQCTFKCHINITTHPLHTQAYFLPKISHSEHSYSNHRLLILREIFDRIFSKTRNYHSFEIFEVLLYCFYRNLSFIFSISQKKLFECNVYFFIGVYISIFDTKKLSRNESRLSAVALTKLGMKIRRQIKGNFFFIYWEMCSLVICS